MSEVIVHICDLVWKEEKSVDMYVVLCGAWQKLECVADASYLV